MPNWETMPLQFYTGLALVVVMIAIAIIVPLALRRSRIGEKSKPVHAQDRAAAATDAHRS